MVTTKINRQLSDTQIFLLKNLAFIPEVPFTAKDLFRFLDIDGDVMVDFFDSLHDLVPEWLEYNDSYYILHLQKSVRIIHELNPTIKDIYKFIEYFVKLYSVPEERDAKLLQHYEPYIISLLRNVKQKSVTFAELHIAYARYLKHLSKWDEAIFMYTQAINMLSEVSPSSPFIVESHLDLAYIYFYRKNYEKTMQVLEKTLDFYKKQQRQLPKLELNIYFLMGETFSALRRYKPALTYYLRSLDILQKSLVENQMKLQTYLHWQIAENYRQLGDYDNALRHIEESEKLVEDLDPAVKDLYGQQVRLQKQIILNITKLNKIVRKLVNYVVIFGIGLAVIAAGLLFYFLVIK